jgi:hypothetical protein
MKLPKFVKGFVDRHGHARFYFRRPGIKLVPLPGLLWSPEFMAAYHEANSTERPLPIGGDRVKPRSIRALAIAYYDSAAFKATQAGHAGCLPQHC